MKSQTYEPAVALTAQKAKCEVCPGLHQKRGDSREREGIDPTTVPL